MRVTHVITRLIVGGAQENTIASVLGLRAKRGMEVRLVSGPTSGPEGSLEPLVAEVPNLLTRVSALVRPVNPWKDCLAFRQLTAAFRATVPDIVHTHSGKAGFLGRLAAARAEVPITVHTIHGPSFGTFYGPLANTAFRGAERFAARFTTHFVVVSDAMMEQYLAAGIGRPEQYTKILSGFQLEPLLAARNDTAARALFGLGADDIVIGKIARLSRLKGHEDLFAIAPALIRSCPRIKFLLVGDGERREKFEHVARLAGLKKHFIFTGLVQPADVPRVIGLMDIVVHLSAREGLPRALPQALAAAKPVVSYNCDGAKEVCLEGETGFLVRPGDLVTLSSRVLDLANDPGLRARLGNRGREFVQERFGVVRMLDALYDLYMRLARAPGLASGATGNAVA
jgi:glycosyltransferase involved in cell wall biosynthesis